MAHSIWSWRRPSSKPPGWKVKPAQSNKTWSFSRGHLSLAPKASHLCLDYTLVMEVMDNWRPEGQAVTPASLKSACFLVLTSSVQPSKIQILVSLLRLQTPTLKQPRVKTFALYRQFQFPSQQLFFPKHGMATARRLKLKLCSRHLRRNGWCHISRVHFLFTVSVESN